MCFTQPFQSQQGLMTLTNSIKKGCDLIKPCKQCHGPQGLALLPWKCERNAINSSYFTKIFFSEELTFPLVTILEQTIVTIYWPLIRYFVFI